MKVINMRSLRTRIILLALFACLLLVAAGTSFFFFLNSTQRAKLDTAQRRLVHLASEMQSDYGGQLAHGLSLDQVAAPSPPAPPPHPPLRPPANPGQRPPSPPTPIEELSGAPLSVVTGVVLRRESDVEGGFYAAKADVLMGYAFPTHEGPGGPGEVPGKERPEIEELARVAVNTGMLQKRNFHGGYDAILFVATPIRDGQKITGAAWLMQRMPGLEGGRSKQLLLGSLGFSGAAIVCVFLTFFITTEVNDGVQTVLARLGVMEGALGAHPQKTKPQLKEFELVLNRVDALSDSLKQKIETQRALEDEVRHRQRLSALGQFAAGVAHELRNPLATIRLRAQMSQRTKDAGAVERNSTVVLNEVDRLDNMIERLLYFSRPIRLQMERVCLQDLCVQAMETWQTRCKAEGVDLAFNVSKDLVALCDRSKLRQVLDNLLDNALHSVMSARCEHPQIELHGRRDGEGVELAVQDNGGGIDTETEAHALEPFFTTKDTGTGLGLSISYEIMQAHGGDLQLRPLRAGGAIATLTMPAAEAAHAGTEG